MKCPACGHEHEYNHETSEYEGEPFRQIAGRFYFEKENLYGNEEKINLLSCPKCSCVITEWTLSW